MCRSRENDQWSANWINLILEAPIVKTKGDLPHTVAVNAKSMNNNYS